jgi:hypothetical protein
VSRLRSFHPKAATAMLNRPMLVRGSGTAVTSSVPTGEVVNVPPGRSKRPLPDSAYTPVSVGNGIARVRVKASSGGANDAYPTGR